MTASKKITYLNLNVRNEMERTVRGLGKVGDKIGSHPPGDADWTKIKKKLPPASLKQIQALFRPGLIAKIKQESVESPGTSIPAVVRTEIEGNPRIGSVIYIRQFHDTPQLTEEERDQVGVYQFEIFKFLIAGKIKHVFKESCYEDFSPNHLWRNGEIRELVKRAFPAGQLPKEPTTLQKVILCDLGAAEVYALLYDDVFVHKTLTKEESDQVDAAVQQGRPGYGAMVIHKREEWAAREVRQFLKDNPGAEVALIYGAAHEFEDNFNQGSDTPVLVSVHFPHLLPKGSGGEK